jgi:hypothetical protein
MKKLIALFLSAYLLAGSLIPGNSFFELSSLPVLIKHYQYHHTVETPGISFLAFVKLHYANPDHQMSDPKNHCNLPLHHKRNTVPIDEIVNSFAANSRLCIPAFSAPVSDSHLFYLPDDQFSSGVFHPPSV